MKDFNFKFMADVGGNSVEISGTADSHQEFIKALSFFTTLPKTGPNGEKDLVFQYRVTKEGHDYYSIVSQEAGMEFQLGQSLKEKGSLFPKEWVELHESFKKPSLGGTKTAGLGSKTASENKPKAASAKISTSSLNLSGLESSLKAKAPDTPKTKETEPEKSVDKNVVDDIKAKYGISGL